ncbi:MAG TPA: DNA-formamidopyrimidine glycosylase family protein, partial [Acidimicrobiales bacterium]|nr:DNA-formamidopyrimidine glycosylase family protein [Acidimicrobiales bacterium]
MPELPEVETVRRSLCSVYAGRTLEQLTVSGRRTVRRHPAERLSELIGSMLDEVGRYGKYLLFRWSS